mmetsp:Transcript_52965/g.115556  ORF Transcript_52965/g.115556 Transcript_52965/m.115556 type:complete len:192 (-) Transcript_52965:709-1284(-)
MIFAMQCSRPAGQDHFTQFLRCCCKQGGPFLLSIAQPVMSLCHEHCCSCPPSGCTLPAAGWYIITYGLGIYVLNLLIGFLSPQVDPETEGPILPTSKDDDFRPFIRRLPEFKFWYSLTKAFIIAFIMTFFSVFNIPVFWPILLLYFIALFFLTMKRQIKHMIKFKYVPFTLGKTKYRGKDEAGANGTRSAD